jgi:choline dehydrogenase-like flavoprotein
MGGSTEAQDTALSKDILGRFICNTWAEATQDPASIDVVVIGGGLFGGYCGSKIFELSRDAFSTQGDRPLRVLVLEAGPFVVPEHTQNIPNLGFYDPGIFQTTDSGSGAPSVTRNFVWGLGWRSNEPFVGQAYCVGGKGVFWGGWCPRLQAVDLDLWPEEVRDYLSKADPLNPVGRRPLVAMRHWSTRSGCLPRMILCLIRWPWHAPATRARGILPSPQPTCVQWA